MVDSQALIWAVDLPSKLSPPATIALQDPTNELLVSAATVWEIAIKAGLKRLGLTLPYAQWMTKALVDLRASLLPITVEYADAQAGLPRHHGDPFDRLIIAQALTHGIAVVSSDTGFDAYGVTRLW